jgi:hypothetical protein
MALVATFSKLRAPPASSANVICPNPLVVNARMPGGRVVA